MRNLKKKRKRIKDLPLSSRPREKLIEKGAENLSDSELIAILLGTGSLKKNAVQLGKSFLKHFPLMKLSKIKASELVGIQGIGRSKISRILAGVELGRRLFEKDAFPKDVVYKTKDILPYVKEFVGKKQEFLIVFYLNARQEILKKEIAGQGSLNNMLLSSRDIFAPAFSMPCASIILVHNHPSGDPDPSSDDIEFTKRIHEAGEMLGIVLTDHLIVAKSGYFSFKEGKKGKWV